MHYAYCIRYKDYYNLFLVSNDKVFEKQKKHNKKKKKLEPNIFLYERNYILKMSIIIIIENKLILEYYLNKLISSNKRCTTNGMKVYKNKALQAFLFN